MSSRTSPRPSSRRNRELVLRECEAAITRLMTDRRYFARPARTLFNNVRPYFAIGDLPRVYFVIDRNIEFALRFLEARARTTRSTRPASSGRARR